MSCKGYVIEKVQESSCPKVSSKGLGKLLVYKLILFFSTVATGTCFAIKYASLFTALYMHIQKIKFSSRKKNHMNSMPDYYFLKSILITIFIARYVARHNLDYDSHVLKLMFIIIFIFKIIWTQCLIKWALLLFFPF